MNTLLVALTLFTAEPLAPQDVYRPAGPRIEFVLQKGGRFIITTDPKHSPKTVEHILRLVRRGFYDQQRFHRVENWVTQWGAPQSKDSPLDEVDTKTGRLGPSESVGNGGSGRDIPAFENAPNVDFYRGVVGIASTGFQVPGDSQIFILKQDALRLYGSYAVLGKITSGMDVVDRVKRGDRIRSSRVLEANPPTRSNR